TSGRSELTLSSSASPSMSVTTWWPAFLRIDSMSLSSEYASSTTISFAIDALLARDRREGGWVQRHCQARDAEGVRIENMTGADTVGGRSRAPSRHAPVSPRGTAASNRQPRTPGRDGVTYHWGHDDTGPADRARDAGPLREARSAAPRPLPADVGPALRHLSPVGAGAAVSRGCGRARRGPGGPLPRRRRADGPG